MTKPFDSVFVPLIVVAVLLVASASAQQVALTATNLAPLTVTTVFGAALGSSTLPTFPGSMARHEGVSGGPGAVSILSAGSVVSPTAAGVHIYNQVGVASGGVSPVAASGEADVLLQFTATSPMVVALRVDHVVDGTAGFPMPLVEIDVGNDGTVEYGTSPAATFPGSGPFPLLLGAVATPVRVHVRVELNGDGFGTSTLDVKVVPAEPLTVVQAASAGCDIPMGPLTATPRFDGGLDLFVPYSGDPVVMVFGLGLAPILLPPTAFLPCLLLPSADLLLPLASPNSLLLPLPAAVRPVAFWAQGVRVAPQGLLTTNAVRVDAY